MKPVQPNARGDITTYLCFRDVWFNSPRRFPKQSPAGELLLGLRSDDAARLELLSAFRLAPESHFAVCGAGEGYAELQLEQILVARA